MKVDIVRSNSATGDLAIETAEIDVEIFDLGSDISRYGEFHTGAQGPAGLGLAAAREVLALTLPKAAPPVT